MDPFTLVRALDTTLRAVCPIEGVSIGDPADRSTWVISFDPTATAAQRSAATDALVNFVAAAAVEVPDSISDRQFFQQLAVSGIIGQADALAAVRTGTVPAQLAALVAALPADQQFGAEMILSGATTFYRNHPMTLAIGSGYGWTSAQVDAFFIAAAAL